MKWLALKSSLIALGLLVSACGGAGETDHDESSTSSSSSSSSSGMDPGAVDVDKDGSTVAQGDCDDMDPTRHPGAAEKLNGVDDDCDGVLLRLERDPNGNGLPAYKEALWLVAGAPMIPDPNKSGSVGGATAGGLLAMQGVTSLVDVWPANGIDAKLLDDHGTIVVFLRDGPFAMTAAESMLLSDWVSDGGGLVWVGSINGGSSCALTNALPSSFGIKCASVANWNGDVTSFKAHALTEGVMTAQSSGGSNWTFSAPAESLATSTSGQTFLAAAEHGSGRFVAVADEWLFYDKESGPPSISFGDHAKLVENIWKWVVPLH